MPIYMNYEGIDGDIQSAAPGGRLWLMGDGSVRFAGPTLYQIVEDILAHSSPGSIGKVTLGAADASGWKPFAEPNGIIAILIGLLLPAIQLKGGGQAQPGLLLPAVQKVREAAARMPLTRGGKLGMAAAPARQRSAGATTPELQVLGPGEQHALTLLRSYLAPGATLRLLGFSGFERPELLGFTGGVRVG